MFEGTTTINFSKEAAMLMMSKNISDLFKLPLEVTSLDFDYKGLEVTFREPEENAKQGSGELEPEHFPVDIDIATSEPEEQSEE